MYNRSTYIGPADDGWSKIVKVDDQYYMVQQGLQEYVPSKNNSYRNFKLI